MLDQAFESLKTFDWGKDPKQLAPIDAAVRDSHGNQEERASLEKQLVAALESDISLCAKDFVCRKLMQIGSAACVPVLAGLLGNKEQSHMARYALERIPAPEAGKAMRDALSKAPATQKAGILASLGSRGEAESVAPLAAHLSDGDAAVARAAALALGAIRSADAARALKTAPASPGLSVDVTDAQLSCAEGLLAAGDKAQALIVYKSLVGADQPKHVRLAATRGVLLCAGKKE